jgi:hypothetical protein
MESNFVPVVNEMLKKNPLLINGFSNILKKLIFYILTNFKDSVFPLELTLAI